MLSTYLAGYKSAASALGMSEETYFAQELLKYQGGEPSTVIDDVLSAATTASDTPVVTQITKLKAGAASAKIVAYNSAVSAGGSATETLTVTGLAVGDTVLAITPKTVGANAASIRAYGTPAANQLSVTFTADPGAGAVVTVLVRKAA